MKRIPERQQDPKAYDKQRKAVWYQKNREKVLAQYALKAEERRETAQRWALTHPERHQNIQRRSRKRRDADKEGVAFEHFMRRLRDQGLTLDQYHALAEKQDFCCAICGNTPEIKKGSSLDGFVVDHSHTTNKVRGLICPNHNVGLGMFGDSPVLLRQAATYLERHI